MNSGSSKRERHCSKSKKFIRFIEVDAGGFWGFFFKLLGFLRFGSSDKNALRCIYLHYKKRKKKMYFLIPKKEKKIKLE
jgi:hypothetical protein